MLLQLLTALCLPLLAPPSPPPADLKFDRYKFVVQVYLGQQKSQGVRVASRCLWDHDTDDYCSVSFSNVSGKGGAVKGRQGRTQQRLGVSREVV